MMGETPNSSKVPRLEASMARSQYRGSEVSLDTIPYSGIWARIKKISRETPVQISFWLYGTFLSGAITSGRKDSNGLNKSRTRLEDIFKVKREPVSVFLLATIFNYVFFFCFHQLNLVVNGVRLN
ncbi:EC1118_1L7_2542p [Saccharomyces cerevisiae EC1118]|uniref:EC1118_1L7_2542p n=1 Tax=Saccharomyces cerevisiae (strain Lalvin EC1118 / Prise de mousse) TaxID=643680 RepID=C8ZDY9_YEAS8|nr:EC1118_1L7_2542p [Saccharomyces cerevisiae EC1118]